MTARYKLLIGELGREAEKRRLAEEQLAEGATPRASPIWTGAEAGLRAKLRALEADNAQLLARFKACKDRSVTLGRYETRTMELERALSESRRRGAELAAEVAALRERAALADRAEEAMRAVRELPTTRAELAATAERLREAEAEVEQLRDEVLRLRGIESGAVALRTAADGYEGLADLYQKQGDELHDAQARLGELRGAQAAAHSAKQQCDLLQTRIERLEGERDRRRQAERAAARVPTLQKKLKDLEFKANKADWDAKVAAKEAQEEREKDAQRRAALEQEIASLHDRVAQLEAEKTAEERERRLRQAEQRVAELTEQLGTAREDADTRRAELAEVRGTLEQYKEAAAEHARMDVPALRRAAARADMLQRVVDKLNEQRILSFIRPVLPQETTLLPTPTEEQKEFCPP